MNFASTHRSTTNDDVSDAIVTAVAEASEHGVMVSLDCGCGVLRSARFGEHARECFPGHAR